MILGALHKEFVNHTFKWRPFKRTYSSLKLANLKRTCLMGFQKLLLSCYNLTRIHRKETFFFQFQVGKWSDKQCKFFCIKISFVSYVQNFLKFYKNWFPYLSTHHILISISMFKHVFTLNIYLTTSWSTHRWLGNCICFFSIKL